nr:hypothetical protein [Marinicella sp. W31]MDC2876929.1 hypothetical protein [Marinicella sp. W31]
MAATAASFLVAIAALAFGESDNSSRRVEKDACSQCHVEPGNGNDMCETGIPQRFQRVAAHRAALSGDNRIGEGARFSRQNSTDPSGNCTAQLFNTVTHEQTGGLQCALLRFDSTSRNRVRSAVEEPDGPDTVEIGQETEIDQPGQGWPGWRRKTREPGQCAADVHRRQIAAGNQGYTLRRTMNDRIIRGDNMHHIAPSVFGRLTRINYTRYMGRHRRIEHHRGASDGLRLREYGTSEKKRDQSRDKTFACSTMAQRKSSEHSNRPVEPKPP